MSAQFNKNGVVVSDVFQENNQSTTNLFKTFSSFNGGSVSSASGNTYTISSAVTSSTWGSGVNITNGTVVVPYGAHYRISLEVYVPTAHNIQIDINNSVPSGATIQGGNDNDANRTQTFFSIPAETWTTITWGSQNLHANNTTKADISVYDAIGLKTADDTSSVSWKIRNPRVTIGWNQRSATSASMDSNNMYFNNFIEY